MRNFKKFLALVLAALMVFSVAVISTSAEDVLVTANTSSEYTEAAQHLAALKIMKGDENGDLMLDSGVTRYQAALFFVQALTGETDATVWNADKSVYFTDVPEYGTAIDYAYDLGIILGRGDGTYGYNDPITYQDLLVMAVRALGYETANMSYPTGYTTAARTLGLTQNIAIGVAKTSPLKRGETAQIIWDMLNTEVAVTDSLSGKILYPGQKDLLLEATGIGTTRTTLLASFSDATVFTTIEAFNAATSTSEATVELGNGFVVKAADLGITADTAKVNYMGLPVEIFIDSDEATFEAKYEAGNASIVFVNYPTYTTVESLGSAATVVKFDTAKDTVTLNGTKFDFDKVTFKTFSDDGKWEVVAYANAAEAADAFADASYKLSYNVANGEVEALVTPYDLDARYAVFTTKDASTGKDADFAAFSENYGTTYKLFGSNSAISENTASVSKTKGAAAQTLEVVGEDIKSGDFFLGNYNKADNILTVAVNYGGDHTGRLTAVASTGKTVKISGTTYTLATPADPDDIKTNYIEKLVAGQDNVVYVLKDNKIVYMAPIAQASVSSDYFDFAIVSAEKEVVQPLLGVTDAKWNANFGVMYSVGYVDEKGLAVAVMNTKTGKFELAYAAAVKTGFDPDDSTFGKTITFADFLTLKSFADLGLFTDTEIADKAVPFQTAAAVLNADDFIVAVVENNDNVYTFAPKTEGTTNLVAFGTATNGIYLSSGAYVTSYISLDFDETFNRISYTDSTPFIVISNGHIYFRTGKYSTSLTNSNTWIGLKATAYAASADLFVIVQDQGATATATNLTTWATIVDGDVKDTSAYYMVTLDTEISFDANDAGEIFVVADNLFNTKTYKTESITLSKAQGQVLIDAQIGAIVKITNGETAEPFTAGLTSASPFAGGAYIAANKIVLNGQYFGTDGTNELPNATLIKATVTTIDLTGLAEDYDFSEGYVDGETYVDGKYKFALEGENGYYAYNADCSFQESVTAETEGVFDQFIVDMSGKTIVVPAKDGSDTAEIKVTLYVTQSQSSGIATIRVYKIIETVD